MVGCKDPKSVVSADGTGHSSIVWQGACWKLGEDRPGKPGWVAEGCDDDEGASGEGGEGQEGEKGAPYEGDLSRRTITFRLQFGQPVSRLSDTTRPAVSIGHRH